MKIDFDEMKKILSTFIDADTPYITLKDLGFTGDHPDEDERFLFHFSLLVESGFISDQNLQTDSLEALGVVFYSSGYGWAANPIRLTMAGHDFAKTINQKPILDRMKKELSDAPFDLVKKVAEQWFSTLLKNKLDL